MLALPFHLAKRSEKPAPRRGQAEYELFKELTGEDWHAFSDVDHDPETKITEFDYEKYLNASLMEGVDTNSSEFKDFVRKLNFMTKTRYEAH